MKPPPVALLLGVELLLSALTVSSVSLSVSPDLQQFFPSEPVLLSCEGDVVPDGWTIGRQRGGQTEWCGSGFGRLEGRSCVVTEHSPASADYWCEGGASGRSQQVGLSVTGGHVILLVPALPVRTGSDVTLGCRGRNPQAAAFFFFFNGSRLSDEPTSELLIRDARRSHRGPYWCSSDEFGRSPEGLLRVKGQTLTTSSRDSKSSSCDLPVQPGPVRSSPARSEASERGYTPL
ncbi:uncharacterized protein ACNS7B_003043 [Menidia menidia]